MGLFILFIGYLFFTQYYSNAQKPPDISSNPTSDNKSPATEFKGTRVEVPENKGPGIAASSTGSSSTPSGNENLSKKSQSPQISPEGTGKETSSSSQLQTSVKSPEGTDIATSSSSQNQSSVKSPQGTDIPIIQGTEHNV